MNRESTPFVLEVVSDTICPWCYIGKRRLETALSGIGDDVAFDVRWRPFELNPDMPRAGMDRSAYRAAKFGSLERSEALDSQVKAAGANDGLEFSHDRIEKTPNTLASHVLIRLAGEAVSQGDVVEAVFKAYFSDGRDIGDTDVLVDIGTENGLERAALATALVDESVRADVRAEAQGFARAGVTGVPAVLVNRYSLFTGAQPPELIETALRRAAAHEDVIAAGKARAGA